MSVATLNVLFLVVGTMTPSSRFRVGQYLDFYRSSGIRPQVRAGYGDMYNALAGTSFASVYKLLGCTRRAVWTLAARRYDLVFLQRTSFPQSAFVEELLQRTGVPLVYDIDDAVYLGPNDRPSPRRERAFRTAVALADRVVVGNEHLAGVVGAHRKTIVIPTAIDVERYTPGPPRTDGQIVIGWMGTSANYRRLKVAVPSLRFLLQCRRDVRLRIVSNSADPVLRDLPRTEFIRWSTGNELEMLRSFDIGIMPLDDTESARAKCGFKLLQYMAVGCPVVGTDIGTNRDIIAGSGGGYLVPPGGDWAAALAPLLDDSAHRRAMGKSARAWVHERYAARQIAMRYVQLFQSLVAPDRSPVAL